MTEQAATFYFSGGFATGILLAASIEFLFWRRVKESTNAHMGAIIEYYNSRLDEPADAREISQAIIDSETDRGAPIDTLSFMCGVRFAEKRLGVVNE
ncbi:MAG: hypothetical protein LLG15_02095 [Betaproteobacteria bacterium]|nr:hypothetical protein [Betaproteobacteria bacterium]